MEPPINVWRAKLFSTRTLIPVVHTISMPIIKTKSHSSMPKSQYLQMRNSNSFPSTSLGSSCPIFSTYWACDDSRSHWQTWAKRSNYLAIPLGFCSKHLTSNCASGTVPGGVWGKPHTTSLSLSKSYSCPFGEDMTPGKQMPIVYSSPQRESRESNLPIIHQVFIPHLLSAGTVLNSVQLAGKESKLLPSWSLSSVSRQVLQVMFHRLPQFMIMVMQ